MEGRLPECYGEDAVEIPGARSLLEQLITRRAPWAIVTSGTEPLVFGWLKALSLPTPTSSTGDSLLVSAESVADGKPDPACYLLGRERLGLSPPSPGGSRVLVLEDSPAGIRAGKAAGCSVLGLVTSHTLDQVLGAGPDWVVQDLRSVKVVGGGEDRSVTLEIRDAFVPAAN